jgi:DNA-binding MarR family transcriptional regulator
MVGTYQRLVLTYNVPVDTTPSLRHLDAYLLSRIGKIARGRTAARLADEGLTLRHHAVLAYVLDAGPSTQRDVGRLLGIDPSDMVGAVDQLEELDYVFRGRDPLDRRRSLITLTREGQLVAGRCGDLAREVADEMLTPLSEAERESLTRMLVRVFDEL